MGDNRIGYGGKSLREIKDAVYYTKKFVQIHSLSGEEKELAFYIKDLLDEFGLDKVYIDELGDFIGFVKGRSLHPLVMLEGHMDHVEPGNLELWKYQPYSGKVINGTIFGRGTVDMKASLASMAFAARKATDKEHDGTLMLCFVVHEETIEGTAIKHVIEKEVKEVPDLVVLGEATNLDLGIGHRGRAVIDVELGGRTAHASMPEHGINALHASSKLISYVEEEYSPNLPFHERLGKATVATVGLDISPRAGPQIPDKARILFDRRVVLGETENGILRPIKEKVNELVRKGMVLDGTTSILEAEVQCWTGTKLRMKNFFPLWLISEDDVIKKILSGILERGLHATPRVWKFSTDGVYTFGLKRIPTVGIGPGEEALAHQPNEYLHTKDIEKAVEAYTAIVESFIS